MFRVNIYLLLLICCNLAIIRCDEKNINKLLNNQVIVSRQIMCVLEKSPCDQLGRQLKGKQSSAIDSYHSIDFDNIF